LSHTITSTNKHSKINQERFRAPEILFNPEIIGLESPGLHHLVVDSIKRTDLDLRSALYSSIVLSGGTTLTKKFPDRLLRELQSLAPPDIKIRILAPPEREHTTWIGGSILGGLSSFRNVSVKERRRDGYGWQQRMMWLICVMCRCG